MVIGTMVHQLSVATDSDLEPYFAISEAESSGYELDFETDNETVIQYIEFYEEFWVERFESLENAFFIQMVGSALIAGCLLATLLLNLFRR